MGQQNMSEGRVEGDGPATPAVQRLFSYRQRTFIITGCRDDAALGASRWIATIQEILADKRLAHWADVATGGDSADAALRRAVLAVVDVADRGDDPLSGRPLAGPAAPRPTPLAPTRR